MAKSKKEKISLAVNELIGKGKLGIIDDTFAPGYIAHAGDNDYSGRTFIKRFVEQLRLSIQNLHVLEVRFLAEDEDTVTWQRTLEGTHEKEMQGIPASGKKVKWVEMVVSRFENEKIAEEWVVSELMGELLLKVPRKN